VSSSPSWLRMRPVISAAPRYGSTVPNPCSKVDVRESVRPEADLHRPDSSTSTAKATAPSPATPSQGQRRNPTTSTDPPSGASRRPLYRARHRSRRDGFVCPVEPLALPWLDCA
jgi:hypothetical protein